MVLTPAVDLALKFDVAVFLSPIADRGEVKPGTFAVWSPEVDHDWLARRPKLKSLREGHGAVRIAVIFAPCEEGGVPRQVGNAALRAVMEIHLELNWVGFQVD